MNYIQLIRSYSRFLSYAVVHAFFSGFGQTFLVSLFIPHIRTHFQLNFEQFGFFYAAATLTSALLLPSLGRQIDHMNLRTYSLGTGLLLMASTLILGASKNLPMLFIGMVGLRLSGQSLMSHIAATTMARYFGRYRGQALGISSLGHPIGEGILPLFVTQLIFSFGWRMSFYILGGICLFVFVPLVFILLNHDESLLDPRAKRKEEAESEDKPQMGRRGVLTSAFFYLALPLVLVTPFLATGLFLHQTEIAELKGWTIQWMATCFVGFALLRIVGSFAIGPAITRWTALKLFPLHLLPMVFGLLALTLFDHPMAGMVYLSLVGLGIGFSFNIISAMWAEVYGTKYLGAIRSMVLAIVIFSTAVSPIFFGWFFQRGFRLDWLLWGSNGLILFCTGLAFIGKGLTPDPPRRKA